MKHIARLLPLFARLRRDRSGAAAVELGLVASMLVGILIPMFDLGMGAYNKMRVQDAAEAGAQYALTNGFNSTSITTAAQSATSLGTGVAVTPSQSCNCINSSVIGATVACGSTCSDGTKAGTYVTVSTSTSFAMLVSYPGLSSPVTLSGTAVVRIN